MKEVEVKARLVDLPATVAKLKALGCVLSKPVTQHDTVFVRNLSSDIDTYLANDFFLRLRVLGSGKIIFTAKYNPSRKQFGDVVSTEHEVEVGSAGDARGIIELLGFKEAVQIDKIRRSGSLGEFEICIDEVTGLGGFIEIERRVPQGSEHEQVLAEIHALLAELGVTEEDKRVKRYDIQMLEQKTRQNIL